MKTIRRMKTMRAMRKQRMRLLIGVLILGLLLALAAGPGTLSARPRADFDGDGRYDLAVGVPGQAVGGDLAAGAVHILYGFVGGLTDLGDKVWHQDLGLVGTDADPQDHFGWSLAAGDFDDDGYADLAIGVPYEDIVREIQGLSAADISELLARCPHAVGRVGCAS